MWNGKSVTVVLTSYREKDSIRAAIEDFFSTGAVDEIVVVDNNAEPGSVEEVQQTKARLVFEKRQGHGWALRRGMAAAAGDYVILCEADGTFRPRDVRKFLAYAEEFPAVLGTRTNKSLIGPGTGMFFLRRVADVFEGKLIEYLFSAPNLTDIGCTYKLLSRDVVEFLKPRWLKGDSHFVTEITLQLAAARIPFVEIPVAFEKRAGESVFTGTFFKAAKWGIKLFIFIWVFWFKWLFSKKVRWPARPAGGTVRSAAGVDRSA